MPVHKCPNGKYRIGDGPCIYDDEETAQRAYLGYLGSKYGGKSAPKSKDRKGAKK